jgi:glyceraldehyde 3-phosphate dehydrogenase
VPTPTVSLCDFVVDLIKPVTAEQVNQVFKTAANGPLNHIMEYSEEELVSMDFKGNPHSCIFDSLSTMVIENNMVKVIGWYDNEWGYSSRLADLAAYVAGKGL